MKKSGFFGGTIILILSLFLVPDFAWELVGNETGKAAREAIEYTARKFWVDLGGAAGKEFSQKAVRFIARHGDEGARVLRSVGPEGVEATARHGDEVVRMCAAHRDDVALYLVRNVKESLPVWRTFGPEGTEAMLRHPGLVKPLLDAFGNRSLLLTRNLPTKSLEHLLILGSKTTMQSEQDALLDTALKRGDDVIDFLWRNKWKIAVGATVSSLLKDYENGPAVTQTGPYRNALKASQPQNLLQCRAAKTRDRGLADHPWLPLVGVGILVWLGQPLLRWIREVPGNLKKAFTPKRPGRARHRKVSSRIDRLKTGDAV